MTTESNDTVADSEQSNGEDTAARSDPDASAQPADRAKAQAEGEGQETSQAASQDSSQESSAEPPEGEEAGAAAAEPSELELLTAERDKLKDQLLRVAADFDNFRKRTRRELEEAKMRGKDDAVRDFLPVIDNLERAVAAGDSAQDVASVVEGVRMVLKLFQDTAERMGLNRVESVGARFDPTLHEAIQQEETDAHAPGTIVREVMPGYMFGKRLIRAAMVVVARAPAAPTAPPPSEESADAGAGAAEGGAADKPSRRPGARAKNGSKAPPASAEGSGDDDQPDGTEAK